MSPHKDEQALSELNGLYRQAIHAVTDVSSAEEISPAAENMRPLMAMIQSAAAASPEFQEQVLRMNPMLPGVQRALREQKDLLKQLIEAIDRIQKLAQETHVQLDQEWGDQERRSRMRAAYGRQTES